MITPKSWCLFERQHTIVPWLLIAKVPKSLTDIPHLLRAPWFASFQPPCQRRSSFNQRTLHRACYTLWYILPQCEAGMDGQPHHLIVWYCLNVWCGVDGQPHQDTARLGWHAGNNPAVCLPLYCMIWCGVVCLPPIWSNWRRIFPPRPSLLLP